MNELNEHQKREMREIISDAQLLNMGIHAKILQQTLSGDIIPPMVSSLIWQTQQEIAQKLIETHAKEEWDELQGIAKNNPLNSRIAEVTSRSIVCDIGVLVQGVLTQPPTLRQRITSRRRLRSGDAAYLERADQDRVIASHLSIPYKVWCGLYNLLCNDASVLAFYGESDVYVDHSGTNLSLSRNIRKGGRLIHLDTSETSQRIETTDSDYLDIRDGSVNIEFGCGTKQSITLDASTLNHALTYINTPDREKVVRETIFSKHSIPVWKNSPRWGDNTNREQEPMGVTAWQK